MLLSASLNMRTMPEILHKVDISRITVSDYENPTAGKHS